MTSIVNINVKTIQQILSANNLGRGTLLEETNELRVFLDNEPKTVMAMHTAASQLEAATGRVVQLDVRSSLGPAQLAQLDRQGTVV